MNLKYEIVTQLQLLLLLHSHPTETVCLGVLSRQSCSRRKYSSLTPPPSSPLPITNCQSRRSNLHLTISSRVISSVRQDLFVRSKYSSRNACFSSSSGMLDTYPGSVTSLGIRGRVKVLDTAHLKSIPGGNNFELGSDLRSGGVYYAACYSFPQRGGNKLWLMSRGGKYCFLFTFSQVCIFDADSDC